MGRIAGLQLSPPFPQFIAARRLIKGDLRLERLDSQSQPLRRNRFIGQSAICRADPAQFAGRFSREIQ
jgi:hypothetical protein